MPKASAQHPFGIIQRDTTVEQGSAVVLSIDTARMYSNFVFSAQDPHTLRWTIWRKSPGSAKYEPVFTDQYNRAHVKVGKDRVSMIYVRYKTPKPEAMHAAKMDSAWVCLGPVAGGQEFVLFPVPEWHKNAVYDLDWSTDQKRVLFALGNDQYPSLTRDGDIFEYNINQATTTNLTNNWDLWSKFCKYSPDGNTIAYTHYANFWYAWPADIFTLKPGAPPLQITHSLRQSGSFQYCTITDYTAQGLLYRRGEMPENRLCLKDSLGEHELLGVTGLGGIQLEPGVFAATDQANNILIFKDHLLIGKLPVSGINNFYSDPVYNVSIGPIADLNWLGRQKLNVLWSTGETTTAVAVKPKIKTIYYSTVIVNGVTLYDTVCVHVLDKRPQIHQRCMTLYTGKGLAYQWFKDGRLIAGANDSSYTPEAAGEYAVTVTDMRGRTATSAAWPVSNSLTDSIQVLNQQVNIVTDPASSKVKITAPFPINVVVVNAAGKIMDGKNDQHEIDMENWPDGLYNFMIYNGGCVQVKSRKIRKEQ